MAEFERPRGYVPPTRKSELIRGLGPEMTKAEQHALELEAADWVGGEPYVRYAAYRKMHRRAQAAERRAIRAEKRERRLRSRLWGLQVAARLLEQATRTDRPVSYVRDERSFIKGFML